MTRPVLVLGATGVIGRGVVKAAVEDGLPIIAVARGAGGLRSLKASHAGADITVLAGSVATEADSAKLAAALRQLDRPLAGVVVAISTTAGAMRGRLLDAPVEALSRQLDDELLPQLGAARHLLPLLADRGGSYVLIGGPGSERPWAGYGYRSVAAAAQRMLACVLHDEARALRVRVQLLTVDTPVRTGREGEQACPHWPCATAVGRRALQLIKHDDAGTAAQALVRYATNTLPHAPPYARAMTSPAPSLAVDPSGATSLLTERCLQDARTLLKTLTTSNPNEVSPK